MRRAEPGAPATADTLAIATALELRPRDVPDPVFPPHPPAPPSPSPHAGAGAGGASGAPQYAWWGVSLRGLAALLLHETGRGDKEYRLSAARALAALPWGAVSGTPTAPTAPTAATAAGAAAYADIVLPLAALARVPPYAAVDDVPAAPSPSLPGGGGLSAASSGRGDKRKGAQPAGSALFGSRYGIDFSKKRVLRSVGLAAAGAAGTVADGAVAADDSADGVAASDTHVDADAEADEDGDGDGEEEATEMVVEPPTPPPADAPSEAAAPPPPPADAAEVDADADGPPAPGPGPNPAAGAGKGSRDPAFRVKVLD